MLTVIYLKENGKMTRLMVSDVTAIRMELNMTVTGKMTYRKDTE